MAALRPIRADRVIAAAGAFAILGGSGWVVGMLVDPERALLAYLTAFAFAASIAVGGLIFLMIGYAASARWVSVLRRPIEAVAIAVIPLALLFVPIAVSLPWIYPWAGPLDAFPEHARHRVESKLAWLDDGFFVARTAVYFALWIAAVLVLRRLARRHGPQRPSVEPRAALARERVISSALLPLVILTGTFAAFDWLMSLDPLWFSTMFGLYVLAGGFLGALATLSLVAWAGRRTGAFGDLLGGNHFHALGRLLLAFTAFWAYCAYFQVFLIAIADRPEEVTFYLERIHGEGRIGVWILAVGHFAVPFLLLLPRRPKHRPGWVAGIAAWLLVMHAYDMHWLVAGPVGISLLDLAAFTAVCGTVICACAWSQRGAPLVAEHDPYLRDGIAYASPT